MPAADGKKKSLRWDEENLDYNEENKTPKMKIDEPPTPFNFDYCDDEPADGEMLSARLLRTAKRTTAQLSSLAACASNSDTRGLEYAWDV